MTDRHKELILTPGILRRFYAKVKITDSCWLWTACANEDGYGRMNVRSYDPPVSAHRLSWIIHFGPIPDGKCVLHDCPGGDNPACVNPAHLWLGTDFDNARDRDQKGRNNQAKGENHGRHKLTMVEVSKIKSELRKEAYGDVSRLARRYGVSTGTIGKIKRGLIWTNI